MRAPDGEWPRRRGRARAQPRRQEPLRNLTTGALTQLSGVAACTSDAGDGASTCANRTGYGLYDADGIAVSPDGLNVYVTSSGDHAIAEFHRNPSTGALSEFACQSDGTYTDAGDCTGTADGLENAIGIEVSADGANVYVAAGGTGGGGDIAEFSRDTSVGTSSPDYGELSQLPYPDDCITGSADLDPPNVQCGDSTATALNGPEDLTLSPDGHNLYANSFGDDAVLEFSRDGATGVLSQLAAPDECISSSGASGCGTTDAPSLEGPLGVAISPDGLNLYVADSTANAVTTLTRDPSTGALDQLAAPDGQPRRRRRLRRGPDRPRDRRARADAPVRGPRHQRERRARHRGRRRQRPIRLHDHQQRAERLGRRGRHRAARRRHRARHDRLLAGEQLHRHRDGRLRPGLPRGGSERHRHGHG
jgi:sugar lactone lactonase YvrE